MSNLKIIFRVHAVQRMFERNVAVKSVAQTLQSGEVIEDYSSEMPEPSRLLLGFQGKRPFHLVISEDQKASQITIITVYIPDAGRWERQFKRRRS